MYSEVKQQCKTHTYIHISANLASFAHLSRALGNSKNLEIKKKIIFWNRIIQVRTLELYVLGQALQNIRKMAEN